MASNPGVAYRWFSGRAEVFLPAVYTLEDVRGVELLAPEAGSNELAPEVSHGSDEVLGEFHGSS